MPFEISRINIDLFSVSEGSTLVSISVNQNPFSRKKRLIVALVCSILASVIAVPGIKSISSFKSRRSDRFIPSTLYSSNRGCSCTLIRRETPVSVFSVMNILTSENKPTLYNLFMASGLERLF